MRLLHTNRTLLSCVAGFCLLGSMASVREPIEFCERNEEHIVPER